MTFLDKYTDKAYSLQDMKSAYSVFSVADPDNHAATFQLELVNIIVDTINGRNDITIVGLTDNELFNFTGKLITKTRG